MKKWVFLAALMLLGYDIVLDSAMADCHGQASVTVCHTCACVHLTNPSASKPQATTPPSHERFVRFHPKLHRYLGDKSFFHPPKAVSA